MKHKRLLGRSEIQVSPLGLGCWAIGGPFWEGKDALGWGKIDINESINAIHAGMDAGINFFDTADVYGAGESERVLGRAVQGKRDKVIIATKFGFVFNETTKQVTGQEASPEYIIKACNNSLNRLETDYIDLYQFHLNDYDSEQAEQIKDVLEELVSIGKIRSYGWSTDFLEKAKIFANGVHCSAIQYKMNVIDRNDELIKFCESKNLASINRGPLAMGLLSGKYDLKSKFDDDDIRGKNSPDWMEYFKEGMVNTDLLQKINQIKEILQSNGRTLVQGAISWLLARSMATIPIPGFKSVLQVEELGKAIEFGQLNDTSFREIENILSNNQ